LDEETKKVALKGFEKRWKEFIDYVLEYGKLYTVVCENI